MEEQRINSNISIYQLEKPTLPMISVVIPTRNEARNLQYVLPYIPTIVSEVILVDGYSADDTIGEAKRLLPDIKIIEQSGSGKGDALKTAFAACAGDIIVMLDADGSTDPREIPLFIDALLLGSDFAKGSRFLKGGGSQDITPFRWLGNRFFSLLVNVLFRTNFTDLCYGYNAFWRCHLDVFDIDCNGFEIETLMNIRAYKAQLKIAEVPSFEYPRIHGESKLNIINDGWRVLMTIFRERTRKRLALTVVPPVSQTSYQ